ncbi:DUF501 domain-containing protein [Varibaculum prostatecancerukia]|uniref:DUF501 domain-containing protein n=1 Tax=Varibaculum prostatecancerukia TaxID=2811781 RepID=UPI001C0042B0|nr:DUF501 domain-containing protein [Varibaculum prostatecancerukia]
MSLQPNQVTDADLQTLSLQLGRVPRGVVRVAARCVCGAPAVVTTAPRLEDGSPFPTTFYLTLPSLVRVLSGLEASGKMVDYQQLLSEDEDLAAGYRRAHLEYIAARQRVGQKVGMGEVPEIAGVSAGGMPERVKCLHALVGHALAAGKGVNPIGDLVLADLAASGLWNSEHCQCE